MELKTQMKNIEYQKCLLGQEKERQEKIKNEEKLKSQQT